MTAPVPPIRRKLPALDPALAHVVDTRARPSIAPRAS